MGLPDPSWAGGLNPVPLPRLGKMRRWFRARCLFRRDVLIVRERLLNGREQVLDRERLGNETVDLVFQLQAKGVELGLGRHHDKGNSPPFAALADFFEQFERVAWALEDIRQDHIGEGMGPLQTRQSGMAIEGGDDGIAAKGEQFTEQLTELGIRFDEENRTHHVGCQERTSRSTLSWNVKRTAYQVVPRAIPSNEHKKRRHATTVARRRPNAMQRASCTTRITDAKRSSVDRVRHTWGKIFHCSQKQRGYRTPLVYYP